MSRRAATAKPSAVRTKKPGTKVTKPVEASYVANERPRQPKLRQTPARKPPPKPPSGVGPKRRKPEADPIEGMTKEARKLRNSHAKIRADVGGDAGAPGKFPPAGRWGVGV